MKSHEQLGRTRPVSFGVIVKLAGDSNGAFALASTKKCHRNFGWESLKGTQNTNDAETSVLTGIPKQEK